MQRETIRALGADEDPEAAGATAEAGGDAAGGGGSRRRSKRKVEGSLLDLLDPEDLSALPVEEPDAQSESGDEKSGASGASGGEGGGDKHKKKKEKKHKRSSSSAGGGSSKKKDKKDKRHKKEKRHKRNKDKAQSAAPADEGNKITAFLQGTGVTGRGRRGSGHQQSTIRKGLKWVRHFSFLVREK